MAKLSKFQAVRMGSEHFTLLRQAQAEADRPFLAEDFKRRAQTVKDALTIHGWRILPDGINVERVK